MVQKSKGGKKSRSVISGKKKKNAMKHNRKYNYKKDKKQKKVECCVCMEEIDDVADNTITCGKVNHTLCRDCKIKCKDCPMCRSHKIKPPISQTVNLPILKMNEKEKKIETIQVEGIDDLDGSCYDGEYELLDGYRYYNFEKELYIYRRRNQWVIDDEYILTSKASYAYTYSGLFGKKEWFISGKNGWFKRQAKVINCIGEERIF